MQQTGRGVEEQIRLGMEEDQLVTAQATKIWLYLTYDVRIDQNLSIKNKTRKILWHFEIQTENPISARGLGLL